MGTVAIFIMSGCPACHDYMPRVERLSAPYRRRGLRISVVDVNGRSGGEQLGRQYQIRATPTTIVQSTSGAAIRRVGAVGDSEIVALLERAMR